MEAFAPSSASAFGFDVVSFRAPDVSASSRRFASRRAYADARRARRSLRRASSRHGAGKRPQSRVVRPENRARRRRRRLRGETRRLADSQTRRLAEPEPPGTLEPSTDSESRAVPRERVERGAPLRRRRQRRERRRHRARARGWKTKRRTLAIPERVCSYRGRRRAFARERARRRRDEFLLRRRRRARAAGKETRGGAKMRVVRAADRAREPRVMKAPHAGRMSPKSQPSVRAFEEDEDVAAANHASASSFASEGDASSSRRTSRVSEGFGVGFESFESSHSGVKMSPARRSASHAGSRNPPSPRGGTVRRTSNASSFARRSGGILDRASAPKSEPSDAGNASKSERSDAGNASKSEPSDAGSNPRRSDRDETVPSASAPRARRRVHLDVGCIRGKRGGGDGVVGGGESIVSAPESGRRLENRRGGETEPRARALGASRGGGIVTRGYRERGYRHARGVRRGESSERDREALEVLRGSGRAAVRDVVSRLSTRPREGEE